MNINTLIEFSIILTIIVFLISIAMLIYYLVKGNGLLEPKPIGNGHFANESEIKWGDKGERLIKCGQAYIIKCSFVSKAETVNMKKRNERVRDKGGLMFLGGSEVVA